MSNRCPEKAKAYSAAYRAANKEKISTYNALYNAKPENKVKKLEYNLAYRSDNKKDMSSYAKEYYENNRESILIKKKEERANNREKLNARNRRYREINPERYRLYREKFRIKHKENGLSYKYPESSRRACHKYRALKRGGGGSLSKGLAEKLFALQKGKCPCCRKPLGKDYHMDHIQPLSKGGTNTDDNIQLLRAKCNLQKNDKDPVEFMQSRGFLF